MKRYTARTRGVVYFMHCPGAQSLKIGFSTRISQRLIDLNNVSPLPIHLIKYVHADFAVEHVLLLLFGGSRTKNEWFCESEELLAFIDSLVPEQELTMEMLIQKIIAK